jgi:hypothetical protein
LFLQGKGCYVLVVGVEVVRCWVFAVVVVVFVLLRFFEVADSNGGWFVVV